MQKTVIGNWKMHGTSQSAAELASGISSHVKSENFSNVRVVLCPPSLHILNVINVAYDSGILIGAQDCSAEEQGAHTGDVSAAMFADAGVKYAIVGHSERRSSYDESNLLVASKAAAAKAAGLIPIICIGETLEQRESGDFENILSQQARQSVPESFAASDYLLAYEPVWAIGTGKVADVETIAETHSLLAKNLVEGANILYGGSVKSDNAEQIMRINHVDGVLVGGASLKVDSFSGIISAAENAAK